MKAIIALMDAVAAVVALFFTATSPNPRTGMPEAERARIEEEVMALADRWHEAVERHDADAVGGLFDRATAHATDGSNYYPDWGSFLAHHRELFVAWESTDTEWINTRIDVLGPDAAFFVGQSKGFQRFANGNEYDLIGYFCFLMRRMAGEWRIVYQQSTGGCARIDPPTEGGLDPGARSGPPFPARRRMNRGPDPSRLAGVDGFSPGHRGPEECIWQGRPRHGWNPSRTPWGKAPS